MYHLSWHFIVSWKSVTIVTVHKTSTKDGVTNKNGKELEIQNRLHTGFRRNQGIGDIYRGMVSYLAYFVAAAHKGTSVSENI